MHNTYKNLKQKNILFVSETQFHAPYNSWDFIFYHNLPNSTLKQTYDAVIIESVSLNQKKILFIIQHVFSILKDGMKIYISFPPKKQFISLLQTLSEYQLYLFNISSNTEMPYLVLQYDNEKDTDEYNKIIADHIVSYCFIPINLTTVLQNMESFPRSIRIILKVFDIIYTKYKKFHSFFDKKVRKQYLLSFINISLLKIKSRFINERLLSYEINSKSPPPLPLFICKK